MSIQSSISSDLNVDFNILRLRTENVTESPCLVSRLLNQGDNHFRNSCFEQPSTYSCAIDCFLEISYRAILNHVNNISRSDFFESMLSCFREIENSNIQYDVNTEEVLSNIREVTWARVINHCRTFRARDINAEFSKIFSSEIFRSITNDERGIFYTTFNYRVSCTPCNTSSNQEVSNAVTTISANQFPHLIQHPETWPDCLNIPYEFRCSYCDRPIDGNLMNTNHPVLKFVEFSPELTGRTKFKMQLRIDNTQYILKAMVRHNSAHFTCAVLRGGTWYFIDDMVEQLYAFQTLDDLYLRYPATWFFAVYVKSEFIEEPYIVRNNITGLNFDTLKQKRADATSYYEKNKEKIKRKAKERYLKRKQEKSKEELNKDFDKKTFDNDKAEILNENSFENKERPLFKSEIKTLNKFYNSLKKKLIQCTICYEAWPMSKSFVNTSDYICRRCKLDKKEPKKFSTENNMIPGKVPDALKGLTQLEEMLISRAFPIMQVYTKPRGGQLSYKGHVITLPNDVQAISDVLPRCPKDIPIIVFQFSSEAGKSKEFRVRKEKIRNALVWLTGTDENGKANNFLYSDISIDYDVLDSLPCDGFIDLRTIQKNEDEDEDDFSEIPDLGHKDNSNPEYFDTEIKSSFLPHRAQSRKEKEIFEEAFSDVKNNIRVGSEPYAEFSTEYLASFAFPTLFPNTKGDPTNNATIRQIGKSDTDGFSEKIKHLLKFSEKENGKWYFRFAAHPRFAFWAYNMLYRRRLLKQGNFYLKQNPNDNSLNIEQLQEMFENNTYKVIMHKLSRYVKNISGTNSYWHEVKEDLKAIIMQIGTPTIFWTLSCAEFHWPEFHSLFENGEPENLRQNIIENPHLIDWFFTIRTENFVKHWLYEIMGAKWHWYRYEFAVMRGSIHCHGLAKLKSDPGLVELSRIALTGFLAKISGQVDESTQNKICMGEKAENTIFSYIDSLVSAENPINCEEWMRPRIHPCKKDFQQVQSDLENDFEEILNSVQRHTKCNSAYCLRFDSKKKESYCRFNFPFEMCEKTKIVYEKIPSKQKVKEVMYRPVLVLKRNDPRLNRYNRMQLQGWRANIDIQPIIDHHACLEYIAKYASKAEKISDVVKDAFNKVMTQTTETDSGARIIRKLIIRSVGERDFSIKEVMHHLLSLKLYRSTFNVISVSLEGTRKINFQANGIESEPSLIDKYATRGDMSFTECRSEILGLNFLNFVSKYNVVNGELKKRQKEVIVRTYPSYYSNPTSELYPQYCKFQLIKYKPWSESPSTLWNGFESNETFCAMWLEFLSTDSGKSLFPDWKRLFHHAESYVANYFEDEEETEDEIELNREEWMGIADLTRAIGEANDCFSSLDCSEAWQTVGSYSSSEIQAMPSWLDEIKERNVNSRIVNDNLDPNLLNTDQRRAFELVLDHYTNNVNKPLLMILTGAAGCGKSFVINCIRQELGECCAVTSYFGIAAFSINGETLHSLLQLPIRNRKKADLKGSALARLQERLSRISYIIIDEFSVIGQKMLGWIDRRCRQAKAREDMPFGGISVILVGDIAQLPPVIDKPLYHKNPLNQLEIAGFAVYNLFNLVIELKVNQRSTGSSESQQSFRRALLNVRNGTSDITDWNLFLSRTVSNNNPITPEHVKLSFSNDSVQKK